MSLYWDAIKASIAAMQALHSVGLPWTDPRTGVKYPPPYPWTGGTRRKKKAKKKTRRK